MNVFCAIFQQFWISRLSQLFHMWRLFLMVLLSLILLAIITRNSFSSIVPFLSCERVPLKLIHPRSGTLIKKKIKLSSYKEIQMGSGAKSFMRKGSHEENAQIFPHI
jgi:hypothetical protein